jgi:hypothetical protein
MRRVPSAASGVQRKEHLLPKTFSITEEEKKQFASAYLLEIMINTPRTFPLWLEGNDKDLEKVLEFMMTHDTVEIKNNRYAPSAKGRKVLTNFTQRYTDFLKIYDVFCAVDLDSGEFAFEAWFEIEDDTVWDNYLGEERWEDLRLAVADYKELNPVEIVFMSFLNEKRFGNRGEGWQFDLLLGSIWDEILEIANSALMTDDLGYEDDDGNPVSGEAVIEDVIAQGSDLVLSIHEQEAEEGAYTPPPPPPDPYRENHRYVDRVDQQPLASDIYHQYSRDPRYVNPVWRRRWWDD